MARKAARASAAAKTLRGSAPVFPPFAPAVALAVLVLVAAGEPESNRFWAVNGLRSVEPASALWVLLMAGAAALWALSRRLPGVAVALAGAFVLAWPLHEAGHFLGDTYVRWRNFDYVTAGGPVPDFAQLTRQMHAQPIDGFLGLWGPLHLASAGLPAQAAVSVASCALALLFCFAVSLLARRLVPGEGAAPLGAGLAIAGSLQVFAGYAESGGVVLAFGALWWFALLRPLATRRDAVFASLAWLALALSHRVALVALVPQFARALAVRLDGDAPGPRRELLAGTLAAVVLAVATGATAAGGAVGRDLAEFLSTLGRFTPPADLANLLVVVMPLALLAPWLTGAGPLRAAARSPEGALHAVALVALAPLVVLFPVAAHGLGAHRDWELAVLPGFVATSFAAHALARLDERRRRGALVIVLPALVLLAGAWVIVNADEAATNRRAEALVNAPYGATAEHRGHALVYLGYRAADRGDDVASARWFDESFASLPNRRSELLAAESWLRAGRYREARASLAKARSRGPLTDEFERVARVLEARVAQAEERAAGGGATR